jgi:hypothetical protein
MRIKYHNENNPDHRAGTMGYNPYMAKRIIGFFGFFAVFGGMAGEVVGALMGFWQSRRD